MTAICGGGASQRKAGVPRYIVINNDAAKAFIESGYPWLAPFVESLPPIAYDLDAFCSADPPTLPTWTSILLAALANKVGRWAPQAVAVEQLAEHLGNVLWYEFCECVVGSPTPPVVPPPPADIPSFVTGPTVAGTGGYLAAVLADSPFHYWRMPDTPPQVWTDIGSGRKPLTAGSILSNIAGPYTGPNSDGGSAFVAQVTMTIAETATISLPYTFECWLYFLSVGGASTNILSGLQTVSQVGLQYSASTPSITTPTITWFIHSSATASTTGITAPMSGWHHYVLVVDGTGAHCYVDGALQGSLAFSTALPILSVVPFQSTGGAAAFISEPAFYKTALSGARIAAHYAAADARLSTPGPQSVDQSIVIDDGLRNMQGYIERQLAPPGYAVGLGHVGLVGTGELSVFGLMGFKVEVLTTGAPTGLVVGDPDTLVDAGFVTIATTDGYLDGVRITRANELFFPPSMSLATRIAYSLPLGVSITVTELLRLA